VAAECTEDTAPTTPTTVVLDTQVVLDLFAFHNPEAPALALRAALDSGRLRWLATPSMRAELAYVLEHGLSEAMAVRYGFTAAHVLARFDALAQQLPTEPPRCPLTCSDPADQAFIALAIAQRVGVLFTRDKALLRLRKPALRYEVRVQSPDHWFAHAHAGHRALQRDNRGIPAEDESEKGPSCGPFQADG
jgi:predicted nucleic acid-binding protein